ncbi:MAG: (Fe-S)-binding protein [Chloroflexi bacterium]|nr:(Fe-S)-binding protein [Chloroflexota bacterium]
MIQGANKKLFLTSPTEEATICARCGYCNAVCCTHREMDWESTSPRGWLAMIRKRAKDGKRFSPFPPEFVQRVYNCTLCGKCGQACPVHIDLRSLWLETREEIVAQGRGPHFLDPLRETVAQERNVFGMPNEERGEWVEFMADAPEHRYQKKTAEVLYYVGCVSSFSAGAQGIPKAMARIMETAGVDFGILGGEEWCCGFPLIVAGLKKEAAALIEHNKEQLRKLGARTVVFNCPSCYHTWKNEYHLEDIELLHSTQFIARLIAQGKIDLGKIDATVTYHDPCDLGRNSGVYDPPREILQRIPGLRSVEMPHHREEAPCCGGGGDFEMLEPGMTQAIASRLVQEAHKTGAERVIVACPQCKRIEMSGVEALQSTIRVADIAELVWESMLSHEKTKPGAARGDARGAS